MEEKIKKIVREALLRNNWGIYFKGHPLQEMPVNSEANMYRINEVRIVELEGAISEELKRTIEEINIQGDTECQKETKNKDSEEM